MNTVCPFCLKELGINLREVDQNQIVEICDTHLEQFKKASAELKLICKILNSKIKDD